MRLPLLFLAIACDVYGQYLKLDAYVEALFFLALEVLVHAQLIDAAHRMGRYFERNPLVFLRNEEALLLQVGQETALGLTVGVRNRVAGHRALTGKLTNFRHCSFLLIRQLNARRLGLGR